MSPLVPHHPFSQRLQHVLPLTLASTEKLFRTMKIWVKFGVFRN